MLPSSTRQASGAKTTRDIRGVRARSIFGNGLPDHEDDITTLSPSQEIDLRPIIIEHCWAPIAKSEINGVDSRPFGVADRWARDCWDREVWLIFVSVCHASFIGREGSKNPVERNCARLGNLPRKWQWVMRRTVLSSKGRVRVQGKGASLPHGHAGFGKVALLNAVKTTL